MWRMPSWEEEVAEFLRVEADLGIPLDSLRGLYKRSAVRLLETRVWSRLQNSDSRDMFPGEHRRARDIAIQRGRDIDRVLDAFRNGGVLPMPVVLLRHDGSPYLIGGNTRLMACRVEGRAAPMLAFDSRPGPCLRPVPAKLRAVG